MEENVVVERVEKKKGYKCDNYERCGVVVTKRKHLKKMNAGFFCNKCVVEKRKEHREYLKRDVLGIRKRSDILKEAAEKRKEREKRIIYVSKERRRPVRIPVFPAIKNIKPKTSLVRGSYLTTTEKKVLYLKYVSQGLDSYNAGIKVKKCVETLNNLISELREKKKSEEEINKRFKEEFAKLQKE